YPSSLDARQRAVLGITDETAAIVVVVSEETGQISLVERGRIVRNLDQARLAQALVDLLEHDELANARTPGRTKALRRTIPQAARRGRSRITRTTRKPPTGTSSTGTT